VGRKPAKPGDRRECLVALEGLTLRWLRWTAVASGEMPGELRKLVAAADNAVRAVQEDVAGRLARSIRTGTRR
jgi:hypothetical protein